MTLSIHTLDVKNRALAAEMRIIRRKENAMRKWNKKLNDDWLAAYSAVHNPYSSTVTPPDVERAATKGIRKFINIENRRHNGPERANQSFHRRMELRPVARASHLALGYLRKTPYRVMESLAFETPLWDKVWDNLVRHGGIEDTVENRQAFMDWADAVPDPDKAKVKHNHPSMDYTKIGKVNKPPSYFIRAQDTEWLNL